MEIREQNIKQTAAEEKQAFVDEVEIFNPLETELERLRQELDSERDARLRLAAEYENYRRRTKREIEWATAESKRELFLRLLSIADDLELAVKHIGETTDTVADGMLLVRRRFADMLRAEDVVAFDSEGETFDPERHEAFDVAHGTDLKPGTVHTEIRRGYFWGDKLLRAALVVVAVE